MTSMTELPTSRRRGLLFGAAGAMVAGEFYRANAATPNNGLVRRVLADPATPDHAKLIQRAIDDVEKEGGGRVELGEGVFHCLSGPVYLDPTKTSLIGDRSTLDFSRVAVEGDRRAALIIYPPAQSTQYGQATQRIEGISLTGPGVSSNVAAILFCADKPAYSSRMALYNVEISNFQDGLRFEDRSYLIQVYSSTIRGCQNSLMAPPNLQDAGENVTFFGCTMGAGDVAICNQAGFEFNFFGTSFDFVNQWYVGGGAANFYGCHFETQRPSSPASLFDVKDDGVLNFHGGTIMVSGNDFDPSPKNASVFHLEGPRSRAVLSDMSVYNLRSSSGAIGTGAGRLITRGLNGGAMKELDPVPMKTSNADLFGRAGEFPDSEIRIEADISSDPSGDVDRYHARYGSMSLEAGALKINKTGGVGNELLARLFCPVLPLRIPSIQLRWKAYGPASNAEAIFWITLSAIQKIGSTAAGKTIIGTSETLGPLQTLRAKFSDAGDGWSEFSIDTLAMDSHSDTDGYTSEWVTHLCINIELINLPENSGILVSDLHAYSF